MKKTISASFFFVILFVSILYSYDFPEYAKDQPQGTINGVVLLKEMLNERSYTILDFQGSKSFTYPECSCHTSLNGFTTSGKTRISFAPDIEGWFKIIFSDGRIYKSNLLEGTETDVKIKVEKNRKYYIVTFNKSIRLTEKSSEKVLYLAKDSVLVFAIYTTK